MNSKAYGLNLIRKTMNNKLDTGIQQAMEEMTIE